MVVCEAATDSFTNGREGGKDARAHEGCRQRGGAHGERDGVFDSDASELRDHMPSDLPSYLSKSSYLVFNLAGKDSVERWS